jgi:hypothetical protein
MKMVTFTRSARINEGKLEAAFEWAVKVAMVIKQNIGQDLQVHRSITGSPFEVHWSATFESLAAFETASAKMTADEGYIALLEEQREQRYLDTSTIEDRLFASVP